MIQLELPLPLPKDDNFKKEDKENEDKENENKQNIIELSDDIKKNILEEYNVL
jgi:hypothetical protein